MTNIPLSKLCPCGSNLNYQQCCQPCHSGAAPASTAQQLMRSRFSAFVMQLWPYLQQTGPEPTNTAHKSSNEDEIAHWSRDKTWLSLRILACQKGSPKDLRGQVEFVAFYRDAQGLQQHHELSQFARIDGAWRFVDGQARAGISLGRNETCPCGSGKKTKRCCLA